jgi:maltooligosyltrehalose trehalohydrolase
VFVYDGRFSEFRRKHHGRPVYNLCRHRFLAYIQTHDQVGNRALGERLNHLTNPDLTKIGACLMLLSPFVPMLFQGQEWAASSPFLYFTDHQDEELAEAVSKGRISEFASFGWDPEKIPDPQARDTFERSVLNWNEIKKQPHAEILNWYKQLILLRKKFAQSQDNPSDTTEAFADDNAGYLVMTRGKITLVCNLSGKKQPLPVKDADKMSMKLCSAKDFEINANSIILPPESAAVLYRE